MFTVLDFMEAYGTSEGIKKEWDSRRHSSVTERVKDPRVRKDAYEGNLRAYGTSEGVKKEWDERGRTSKVLKGHGWHQYGNATDQHAYGHRIHKEHTIFVKQDGSWTHQQDFNFGAHHEERGSGSTGAELQKHLLSYNWGGKQGKHRN